MNDDPRSLWDKLSWPVRIVILIGMFLFMLPSFYTIWKLATDKCAFHTCSKRFYDRVNVG